MGGKEIDNLRVRVSITILLRLRGQLLNIACLKEISCLLGTFRESTYPKIRDGECEALKVERNSKFEFFMLHG